MYYCLCWALYDDDEHKLNVVSVGHRKLFQCPKCFYIDGLKNVIVSCEYGDEYDDIWNLNCNKCIKCVSNNIKYKSKTNFEYFGSVKVQFQKLYLMLWDNIGKYVLGNDKFDALFVSLIEYHRWLVLISKYENLAPNPLIGFIWKTHALDTKNYEFVCNSIHGSMIYYQDWTFVPLSWKHDYDDVITEKYSLTLYMYEYTFESFMDRKLWNFIGGFKKVEGYVMCNIDDGKKMMKIPFNSTMSVKDVKNIIKMQDGRIVAVETSDDRIVLSGKMLEGNIVQYGVTNGATLFIV